MALLNSLVNSSKPKDKGTSFSVVMIHYSKLIPSENNNYSVDNINELANMILLSGGIKQNLLARKKSPDEYELIAGHRRRLAVKRLVEELGHPEFAMVPVHVEKEGDLLSEVNLILTNCGARERSDWEKMMEVARLTELMKAMQTGSEEEQERFRQLFGKEPGLGGRELRKVVAETLGLSETKVANLSHINSKLAPELKEKFREGEIGVSVANEAAGLPPEEQQKLAEKPEIKLTDVKKKSVSDSDTAAVEKNEEIPGQMSVADYPGVVPNGAEDAAVTQQTEATQESDAKQGNELSAYGTEKKIYPPDSLIATPGCKEGHWCFSCGMECQIRQADRYCREAPMGNPFPCETLKWGLQNQQNEIGDRCQFINHDLADHCAGSGEADPCCKNCSNPCEYICGRAMRKMDEQQKVEEAAAAEKEPDESWNIGELPQARDQHLRKLAEILAEAKGIQMVVNRSDSYLSEDTIKSNLEMLAEQNSGSIDIGGGAEAWPSQEMIEFCAGGEDLGVCSYVRFANHVRKVMKTWTPGIESKPEENVIDPEFTEVADTEEYTAQYFLQKEQQELKEILEAFKDTEPEKMPREMIAHKKIIVAALAAMVCDLEETELQKQMQWPRAKQPDLPVMRNNDKRKEFLETFHDWPVWFRVPEASEVYYRYDLPDRTALVICEYKYYAAWMEEYGDMDPESTGTREYLLTPGYHYLDDCRTNQDAMIKKLKEIQKKG